eukprot:TRINITY_DN1695_c0_g1_i2.p1 TRINITY_DN1695_c0_g1~~TRINITY_DN1695_c0_g1_i2.p1  ORF type:complete len:440 (-),score=92.05 TRINITY_DN1695_c0_g1_i2:228-1547(-)
MSRFQTISNYAFFNVKAEQIFRDIQTKLRNEDKRTLQWDVRDLPPVFVKLAKINQLVEKNFRCERVSIKNFEYQFSFEEILHVIPADILVDIRFGLMKSNIAHFAVALGDKDMCAMIRAKFGDSYFFSSLDRNGYGVVQYAVMCKSNGLFQSFIEENAELVDALVISKNRNLAHIASIHGNRFVLDHIFAKKKEMFLMNDEDDFKPIHLAADRDAFESFKFFCDNYFKQLFQMTVFSFSLFDFIIIKKRAQAFRALAESKPEELTKKRKSHFSEEWKNPLHRAMLVEFPMDDELARVLFTVIPDFKRFWLHTYKGSCSKYDLSHGEGCNTNGSAAKWLRVFKHIELQDHIAACIHPTVRANHELEEIEADTFYWWPEVLEHMGHNTGNYELINKELSEMWNLEVELSDWKPLVDQELPFLKRFKRKILRKIGLGILIND